MPVPSFFVQPSRGGSALVTGAGDVGYEPSMSPALEAEASTPPSSHPSGDRLNMTVSFAIDELDRTPAAYALQITATRTSDGKRRAIHDTIAVLRVVA